MIKNKKFYEGVEGIKKKGDNLYVSNPLMYKEWCRCNEKGELSDDLVKMFMLLCENIGKKRYHYKSQEDKDDCIQNATMECITKWQKFDPEKAGDNPNPFAYFTSVATMAMAAMFNELYPKDSRSNAYYSIISLDNENIHSL